MSANVCSLCGGSGQNIRVYKMNTGKLRSYAEPCWCKLSNIVSGSYKMLSSFADTYLPIDEIDPKLEFDANDSSKSPNLLIQHDSSFDTFRVNVKSIIMKYRLLDPLIYFDDSIDILHRFYVQQNDGSCLRLTETQKYDLFIFTLGTNEKNDQLKTIVVQTLYHRKIVRKPTWIYMLKPYDSCVYEASDELKEYLKDFKVIKIADKNYKSKPVRTKSQISAVDFTPGGK